MLRRLANRVGLPAQAAARAFLENGPWATKVAAAVPQRFSSIISEPGFVQCFSCC